MAEQFVEETVSVEAACDHADIGVKRRIVPQGNGFILHVDEVICKKCQEIFVMPMGKGRHSKSSKIVLLPASVVAVAQQQQQQDVPQKPAKNQDNQPCDPTKGCVGTEMLALTAELGIEAEPGCTCKYLAAQMDRMGLEGCRNRENNLIFELEANWSSWGWKSKLTAIRKSAWKAAGLRVNPTDPLRSLLELAFDRAERKMKK